jgi:hypothetical protein
MVREFNVVIEKDEDGFFVASVPTLRGCHTQAKSLDVLMKRIRVSNLIKKGMPAIQINGIWYSHIDNIEEWFRRVSMKPHRDRSKHELGRS